MRRRWHAVAYSCLALAIAALVAVVVFQAVQINTLRRELAERDRHSEERRRQVEELRRQARQQAEKARQVGDAESESAKAIADFLREEALRQPPRAEEKKLPGQ
jgi:hypothetical protein